MRVPNQILRERIVIENYEGSGARGPVYAEPRTVRANVQQTSRLMTDNDGSQVTADTLCIIRPEAGPVPAESRVEWNGQTFRVIRAYPMPDTRRPSQWELAMSVYAGPAA